MKRLMSVILGLAVALGGFGLLPAGAASYRPVVILERMDLSKELAAPFRISTMDDEVTPAAVGTIVEDGNAGKALHITGRKSEGAGLSVNLKSLQQTVGNLSFSYQKGAYIGGEYYALTFSIRAEKGQSFYIMPVLGGGGIPVWNADKTKKLTDSNGYLGNFEARHRVTDQWTTIGIKDNQLVFFTGDATYQIYQPNPNSWCGLYFVTFTDPAKGIWDSKYTGNYYLKDFCFWGPKALASTADGFVDGVSRMPEASQAQLSIEETLGSLEAIYKGLSSADRQRGDVQAAKTRLGALQSAVKKIRRPFVPTYTYSSKENLLAPYGDLESFDGRTYIWGESPGSPPQFTLVEDASIAKQGKKCLLISGRKSQADLSFDITPILRDNGGGKYYFSCWMKAKDPGVRLEVLPLVLYVYSEDEVKEFEIGETIVTDQWTQVGVTIQDIERYFRNQGQGLDAIDNKVNYAVLRFYTSNVDAEEEKDFFPDFYIDDLKFWKDSEKLPGYVPPTTAAPVQTTASSAAADNPHGTTSAAAMIPPAEEAPADGMGLLIGLAAGAAVLVGLFALFWFVLRPRMLSAAGTAEAEDTHKDTENP